ncbi:MAG: hypothetical protein WC860_10070 [Candidatus Margulisiibacteriota bacterium]
MKVRCQIPIDLTISSETKKPNLGFNFELSNKKISSKIIGNAEKIDRRKYKKLPKYLIKANKIKIEVEVKYCKITKKTLFSWYKLFVNSYNQIISKTRCFGETTNLHYKKIEKEFFLYELDNWIVERSGRIGVFDKIAVPLTEKTFKYWYRIYSKNNRGAYLYDNKIEIIRDALEENYDSEEIKELNLKAIEQLESGEIRFALLDAVFCLETSMANYFKEYFKTYNAKMPEESLKDFLSPTISLKGKIGILVALTIDKSYLEKIDINKVFAAVTIRNNIAHYGKIKMEETGEIISNIENVILLNKALFRALEQMRYFNDKLEIKNTIDKKHGRNSVLWIYQNHTVIVGIDLLYEDFPLKKDFLYKFINLVNEARLKKDKKFNYKRHLSISFKKYDKTLKAIYNKGRLKIINFGYE